MPQIADRRKYDADCPVARSLDTVGERWTLLIVRELLAGPLRFSDLKAGVYGINATILSRRLGQMVEEGLVRTVLMGGALPIYALTPRGEALWPLIAELARWDLFGPQPAAPRPVLGISAAAALLTFHLRWPADVAPMQLAISLGPERFLYGTTEGAPFRRSTAACETGLRSTPKVLHGLALGRLPFGRCEAEGLIQLEGPGPAVARLRRALGA